MAVMLVYARGEGIEASLAAKFEVIFPHLDERQRRLLMGAEARVIGHGGIRLVARAADVREATVSLGGQRTGLRCATVGANTPIRWWWAQTRC